MLKRFIHFYQQLTAFSAHVAKATDQHGIHSPFIFDWYNEVVADQKKFYAFDELKMIRKTLASDRQKIVRHDLGAGSVLGSSPTDSIGQIARRSLGGIFKHELLFRMVDRAKPKRMVELGTSLGLSSLYMHRAAENATLATFEGDPSLCEYAKQLHRQAAAKVAVVCGNIDQTLPKYLANEPSIDFYFMDANHRFDPTMRYLSLCLAHATPEAVVVMDDIHWSKEMQMAWQQAKNMEQVKISVDLFCFGVLFLRDKQPKQHFVLKY